MLNTLWLIVAFIVGALSAFALYWFSLRAGLLSAPRVPRSLIRRGQDPTRQYMAEEARRIDRTVSSGTSQRSRVTSAHMVRRGRAS